MRFCRKHQLLLLMLIYSGLGFGVPAVADFKPLRAFFSVDQDHIKLTGVFFDTPAEYGKQCELWVDFSSAAGAYISLRGEYAPKNSVGEGIYFADAEYKLAEVNEQSIVLSQTISNGFGNDVATEIQISKQNGYWLIDLKTSRTLWWLTDTVIKHCKVAMNG